MTPPNRVFTNDQVNEIVALHKSGKALAYISDRYGHRPTVQKILAGTAYRDVTHADGPTCCCPSCVNRQRGDANFAVAQAATVLVMCAMCPGVVERKVSVVLAKHGNVTCPECRGVK